MKENFKKFGQLKDKPDSRDYRYSAPREILKALPPTVNLINGFGPVYDQGNLGSCTAQAIAAGIHFAHKKQFKTSLMPSRLFIYYNERVIEGSVDEDSGAYIRDGIKTVNKDGVCKEVLQPYKIANFRTKPTSICYERATKDRVVSYQRITQNLNQMKGCLASGYPFVFGFLVYESFDSAEVERTGVVPIPKYNEELLGGHAVIAVGYNDSLNRFLVRNSWGVNWGLKGYFSMPYQYLINSGLSDDFQTIKFISN